MEEKISCILVDDEPAALDLLKRYADRTPFLNVKATLGSAIEVLDYLQHHEAPELFFLDIQMPELTGIELGKTLPAGTKIIFTTAFDRYAIEGYKVNALDYLLKPIDYGEFLAAAVKARDWFTSMKSKNNTATPATADYIFVKSEYKQLKINLADILYIEGFKDYAKIYLTTEKHPILSLISLKKLEEELPAKQFMRVHRSYIVALNKIDQIERNQVIIGEQRITIADQYKEAFQEFIQGKSV